MCDYIQEETIKIRQALEKEFKDKKFTVKFNGEFFIASPKSHDTYDIGGTNLKNSQYLKTEKGRLFFCPKNDWLQKAVTSIKECKAVKCSIEIESQIKRLEKQLEFKLTGGEWGEAEYGFAKDILYIIHTKSKSIRRKVVRCLAKEYNILQRKGKVPTKLTEGYKNALCLISYMI